MCRFVCKNEVSMATNLAIDDDLLIEALNLSDKKTKKDVVNEALLEYVQKRKQVDIISLFGKIDYREDYDYKKARDRK